VSTRGRLRDDEAGYTLTEVLAALIVLGVAITAIISAMGSSIIASDIHRKIVTDDAIVRSYAERLEAAPYVDCATPSNSEYSAAGVNLDLNNWPGYSATVVKVEYWNGDGAFAGGGFTASCSPDRGLQRITLEARSSTTLGSDATKNRGGHPPLQILKRRP
jgi:prepilin-type N-terminal cleavage/methylation domain-containing protein